MSNGFTSYLETALWSTNDGDKNLDDDHGIYDFDPETLAKLETQYQNFVAANFHLVDYRDADTSYSRFGHNLWLTQNYHGVGFWDGGYRNGIALTAEADKMNEVYLYIGDDGKIYA